MIIDRTAVRTFLVALAALVLAPGLRAAGADLHDDFRSGAPGWTAGSAWTVRPGVRGFGVDSPGDSFAWSSAWRVERSWSYSAKFTISKAYGDSGRSGSGAIAFASSESPTPKLLATVERRNEGVVVITLEWYLNGVWHASLQSGWLPGRDRTYRVRISREACDDHLKLSVQGDRGLSYSSETPGIPIAFLDALTQPGLRANQARVLFTEARLTSPTRGTTYYRTIARAAVNDLLRHFWTGDADSGHASSTWNGYVAADLPDRRGAMWERGTLITVLDSLYQATGDQTVRRRIAADWRFTKASYTASELETAGTGVTPACDDCGWNALGYLRAYRASGDPDALVHAKGLVDSSFARWMDGALGGGMWYNDERKIKSLYEVGIVCAALEIWDITKEPAYRDRAVACYEWMERKLLRPDGLYWCDVAASGPMGGDRPNEIHQAGSVTFLAGDMAMGVLHARLFKMTGRESYRLRAIRTADAIRARLTDGKGVLLDERDAWANGTFAGDWAREVLGLKGVAQAHLDLLRATAQAIYSRDRTSDGYFGGCWNGPADGRGSVWSVQGSRPLQVMTSANAVSLIAAAAALDARAPRQGR